MITRFSKEHWFLSNMYPLRNPIVLGYYQYPTVEHAYQASKSTLDAIRKLFSNPALHTSSVKGMGRRVQLRPDWNNNFKLDMMYRLVKSKFVRNPELGQKLLSTGSEELIEGNDWGDTFWGVHKGRGENNLGKILMRVRKELSETSVPTPPRNSVGDSSPLIVERVHTLASGLGTQSKFLSDGVFYKYCGRPSELGNPYKLQSKKLDEINRVNSLCWSNPSWKSRADKFVEWVKEQHKEGNLQRLLLGCWCPKGQPCHTDYIRMALQ